MTHDQNGAPEPDDEEDIRSLVLARIGAPERYVIPRPYELNLDGVWTQPTGRDGMPLPKVRIAFAPLIVLRLFTDPSGEQLVELAWADGTAAVSRTVARSIAKSGRKLVQTLGNAGIPIVEADARSVERYLAALESANRATIPRDHLARQLGWQTNGDFVTGQDTPWHIEPVFEEQRTTVAAHHPCGTLAEWGVVIKKIEPYPLVRAMLAAAFATALLRPLNVDSFTIDLSGRSTGGKSTAAKTAYSAWGCPTEKGGGIASWRTSIFAAEKRLNLCNGVPVVFDETRAVKDEDIIDKVLYQVPMNRGTQRGNGWPNELPWHTILISTGEQSALSFTTNEGASARILSLRGAPFGRDGERSARVAREVGAGIEEQYGTAGPAFAARLREHLAATGAAEELRRRHAALAARHREGGDVGRRRAVLIGALRLAAELAHEWDVCPLPSLDERVWADLFAVEQERDDRGEMALDIAREFVAKQEHRMWTALTRPEHIPPGGWIGAYLEEDGRKTVVLLAAVLGEELQRRGYRIDAAREAWRDRGQITLDAKGELVRRRFGSIRNRVYEFDRRVFDCQEFTEDTLPNPDDSCPDCGWAFGSTGHHDACEGGAADA